MTLVFDFARPQPSYWYYRGSVWLMMFQGRRRLLKSGGPCRAEGISCGVFRDLPEKKLNSHVSRSDFIASWVSLGLRQNVSFTSKFQRLLLVRHKKYIQESGGRHLGFVRTVNSAFRSGVPENPTLEPNKVDRINRCIDMAIRVCWGIRNPHFGGKVRP